MKAKMASWASFFDEHFSRSGASRKSGSVVFGSPVTWRDCCLPALTVSVCQSGIFASKPRLRKPQPGWQFRTVFREEFSNSSERDFDKYANEILEWWHKKIEEIKNS